MIDSEPDNREIAFRFKGKEIIFFLFSKSFQTVSDD